VALDKVSLQIRSGEFICIIGPSGCGKTTLLHCMGGLATPSDGVVRLDSTEVRGPRPTRAAYVFQDYSLLPWKTVLDNAAVGLRFAGIGRAERNARALEALEFVGLADRAGAYPAQLSGGMQQRVAISRALTMDPDILLLDEPFGALDELTRRRLGVEMAARLGQTGKTMVMVTHSLDEAILWADRVVVMAASPGRIRSVLDVPDPRPRTADFLTAPEFNERRSRLWELLMDSTEPVVA
jgi:NitT/TauT family transport system ATP-binding protein